MELYRHLGLLSLAAVNLSRQKAKTFSLLFPLSVLVATFGAITFLKDGLARDAKFAISFLPEVTVQQTTGGRVETIEIDLMGRIRRLPHVSKVYPRVWGYLPVEMKGEAVAYTILGIDLESLAVEDRNQADFTIERGSFVNSSGKFHCVVGKALAAGLDLDVGDKIQLEDHFENRDCFEVVGIFASPVQIYASDLLLTDISSARTYFGYSEHEASDICVYLDHPSYAGSVAEKITEISTCIRVLSKDTLANITEQAFGGRAGVFQLLWLILLLTSTLVAWSQASHISIERKREIGIYKALGWEIMDVIEVSLMETSLLAGLATLLGTVLGLGYLMLDAPGIKSYFLGWATFYPDFPTPMAVSCSSLCLLFAICIVPLWVATVVPAWLLGTVEPDRAIRG